MLRTFLRRLLGGSSPELLRPGRPAPEFELPDQAGNRVRLADFRGQRVVLWFYPKADTPG